MGLSILERLKKYEPFSIITEKSFHQLLSLCNLYFLYKDELLISSREKWPGMYFLLNGELKAVSCNDSQKDITLGEGAILGVKTLMSTASSKVDILGGSETNLLLYLSKDTFNQFLAENPAVLKIIKDYISFTLIKDFLIRSEHFTYVPIDYLQQKIKSLTRRTLESGEFLIKEGEVGNEAYIIERGIFRVFKNKNPKRTLALRRRGELIGEIALIKNQKRMANIVAGESSSVFVLPRDFFLKMFDQQKELQQYMHHLMQKRLGMINKEEEKAFPFFPQKSEKENAAACLGAICQYYYKKHIRIDGIRRLISETQSSSQISKIVDVASQIGFSAFSLFMSFSELIKNPLPALLLCKKNHWIVIYKIVSNETLICDPAIGLVKMDNEKLIQSWTGYVILLKPNDSFFKNWV